MNRVTVFCVMLLLFSCTNNDKVPEDVIPKPKMEKLLWDMVKADRFTSIYVAPKTDSAKRDSAVFSFYDKVFQLNGVTREQFLKSYKFYLSRPDLAKIMFDSISARAERNKSEIYKRRKTDSSGRKILSKPLKRVNKLLMHE